VLQREPTKNKAYIYNTRASKHRGPDKEKSRKLSLGLSTSRGNLLGHARVRALMHPLMSKRRKNCIKCEFQHVHTGSSVCVCVCVCVCVSLSLSLSLLSENSKAKERATGGRRRRQEKKSRRFRNTALVECYQQVKKAAQD
jgi:hypothetical protein